MPVNQVVCRNQSVKINILFDIKIGQQIKKNNLAFYNIVYNWFGFRFEDVKLVQAPMSLISLHF